MPFLLESLYRLVTAAARPVLPAASLLSAKAAAAVAGRRDAGELLRNWGQDGRVSRRPLLWLHGASAGELAGAAPVVSRLRLRVPDLQLLVTYSSPSGESAARGLEPDLQAFAPLDTVRDCEGAIDATAPDALVFAKGDLWPGLTRAAAARGVPLGAVNATVRSQSRLLSPAGRALLAPSWRRLSAVGAATEADAGRLIGLGLEPRRVRITGDASLELALDRVAAGRARLNEGRRRLPGVPPGAIRVVAGSTWREDEDALVRAIARLRVSGLPVQLVLVPHELEAASLRRLEMLCREYLGGEPLRYSSLSAPGSEGTNLDHAIAAPAIVIDAVGFLAELYLEGTIAFVGGAFGRQGLHSVAEPAAAGLPVMFGPRHDRWEADDLLACGGALRLEIGGLEEALRQLLARPARIESMGTAARGWAETGRGAADAGAGLVAELIRTAGGVPS